MDIVPPRPYGIIDPQHTMSTIFGQVTLKTVYFTNNQQRDQNTFRNFMLLCSSKQLDEKVRTKSKTENRHLGGKKS